MKKLKMLIAVCLLTATASYAVESSEADKKWSDAVEKMIVAGPATISTPDENRAKLAQKLATKHECVSKIEKTQTGYKITVQKAQKVETATN